MWQTPKTDWTRNDYLNVSDINRWENNTQEVKNLIASFHPSPALGTIKTTWVNTDFPYYDELNRIESNILALKNAFYQPVGWITPKTDWVTGPIGDGYILANRIETDLKLLYELATNTKDNIKYCGTFYCGGELNGL